MNEAQVRTLEQVRRVLSLPIPSRLLLAAQPQLVTLICSWCAAHSLGTCSSRPA